jgi:hypothetical protein
MMGAVGVWKGCEEEGRVCQHCAEEEGLGAARAVRLCVPVVCELA